MKKLVLFLIGFSALVSVGAGAFGNSGATVFPTSPSQIEYQQPAPVIPTTTTKPPVFQQVVRPQSTPQLSNDNYYINTYGNTVHSPAYSNTVPAGASAICRDGTYSFSQSRRGTCSHHGGVAEWL